MAGCDSCEKNLVCPWCGMDDFDTPWALGTHIRHSRTGFCEEIPEDEEAEAEDLRSDLQSGELEGEDNPFYGESHTEETKEEMSGPRESLQGENNPNWNAQSFSKESRRKISEGNTGKEMSKEAKEKLSESMSGQGNPRYGVTLSEETREKISEAMTGKLSGEDHPLWNTGHTQESREKMRKTIGQKEEWGGGKCDWYDVQGLRVQGTWEREVARILLSEFDISDIRTQVQFNYRVDFLVQDRFAIEVKGYTNDSHIQKGKEFVQNYPEYEYIVVGSQDSEKIPCDRHISWDNRGELV